QIRCDKAVRASLDVTIMIVPHGRFHDRNGLGQLPCTKSLVRVVRTNLSAWAFRPRAARWDLADGDAGVGQHGIEGVGELAGPVADQDLELVGPVAEVHE